MRGGLLPPLLVAALAAGAAPPAPAAAADLAPYGTQEIFLPNIYSLKRKIQWDGGREHRVFRTDHFEIVVAEGEEELGRRVAGIAEPFYVELEERLALDYDGPIEPSGKKGPGRIPLIAYTSLPRFQETNTTPGFLPEGVRGFFEFVKGRIVFPHTGSNVLLEHVARHEIVHAFALNASERGYERYRDARKRLRDQRGDWQALVGRAREVARAAPKGLFGSWSRDKLHPKGTEVGLPNAEAARAAREGRKLLAPRLYVGWPQDEEGRAIRGPLLVSVQAVGERRIEALVGSAGADSLDRALEALPDSCRVVVRRVTWERVWEAVPRVSILYDHPAPAARGDHASLRGALDAALAPPEGRWGRRRAELVLLAPPAAPGDAVKRAAALLLPCYAALSGVVLPDTAGPWPPPDETYEAVEDTAYLYVPPSLKPRLLPLALNEGAAEYFGSDWDAVEEMVLRDALFSGRIRPVNQLGPQDGYLVYVLGESFLRYLGETYGDEVVSTLVHSLYLGERVGLVLEILTGRHLDDLTTDWEESLRRRVFPDYARTTGPADWSDRISDGPFDTAPRAWRDATIYKRAHRGRTELVIDDAGAIRVLAEDRRPGTESLHLLEIAIDVQGDRLAFAVQAKGVDALRVIGLPLGETLFEKKWPEVLGISGIALSPGGDAAIFSGLDRLGNADLYHVSFADSALRRITNDFYEDASPTWGDSGIAFVSDRGSRGSTDLYLLASASEGAAIRRVTRTPWNETEPAWLPGGEGILALDDRSGVKNVARISPGSGESVPLSRDRIGIAHLGLGADRLVFSTFSGFTMKVWQTPLDDLLESPPAPADSAAGAGGETIAAAPADSVPAVGGETIAAAPADSGRGVRTDSTEAAPRNGGETPEGTDGHPPGGGLDLPDLASWTPPPVPPLQTASYKPRYGPDLLLLNASSYGGGAYLGLSDLLGDRQFALLLGSNSGSSGEFLRFLNSGLVFSNLEGRVDWRVGALRTGNEYLTEEEGFFFERNTGILFGMTYPFDRFRSISGTVTGSYVERDVAFGPDDEYGEVSLQTIFGHDTTIPDEYGYGYGSGLLTSLLLSTDYRITDPTGWNDVTGIFDVRRYFPLVGRAFLATRGTYGLSSGRFPQRIRLGGAWTLRGFKFNDLQGDRFLLGNLEVRFPLPLAARIGDVTFLRAVQAALFVDAGDAWFAGRGIRWKGALGFGFRTGFAGTILRWDVAKRYDDTRGGFSDDWRSDLFIGYNF